MSRNKKIDWINALRAIGIITVVIGHNDTIFTKYIYSFHMPLFFFLSGLTYDSDKWNDGFGYMKRKAKALLFPYFLYSAFLYIIWIPIDILKGKEITNNILIRNFIGIFYSQGGHEYMTWGVPMWFLTCSFLVSIIYYYISKLDKRRNIIIALITCGILGYLTKYLTFRLPWSLDTALTAIVFYGIGNLLRENILNYKIKTRDLLVLPPLLVVTNLLVELNGRVDLYSNKFNNYLLFYITALLIIFGLIAYTKALPKSKILNLIGNNTLPIMAFHIRVLEILKLIIIKIFKLNVNVNGITLGFIILPVLQISIIIFGIIIIRIFKNKLKNIVEKRYNKN